MILLILFNDNVKSINVLSHDASLTFEFRIEGQIRLCFLYLS